MTSTSSPYLEHTDSHGNRFYLADFGGFLIPPFPSINDFPQHARDVREMELSPDDVIITGWPKSGMHWVTSIVHMLVHGNTDTYYTAGLGAMLDRTPFDGGHIAPPQGRPRIFYSHFKHQFLPRQIWEKKVKVVYLHRNPKDAWVSLFNHVTGHLGHMAYDGTWHHFFRLMISSQFWYGNWFDYAMDWDRDLQKEMAAGHPIFINPYEVMSKDPVGQIEKLDQFLGTNRGRELCEQIAEKCNFSSMKAAKKGEWKGDKFFKENAVGYYRKGEVGDWKNWFTVAESEEFDQEFSVKMKGSKLRYTVQ